MASKPKQKIKEVTPKGKPKTPDGDVTAFLRELSHPLKKDIETVRATILGVSSKISEAIKWNSLSFCTTDYFATVFLRSTDQVQLIFHKGAKLKDNSTKGMEIADPDGLVKWLAKERCMLSLGAGKQLKGRQAALKAIVQAWIGQM